MGKINLKNIVLFVIDIQTARNFYEELLDQEIEHDFGRNVAYKGGLSLWQLSEKHILFEQLVGKQATQKNNRMELYFEVDDIDAMYIKLDKANIRFLHRLHIENWQQKTIRFFDPDHHLIEVGESLVVLVNRLQKEGHAAKEIAELTNLSLDFVQKNLKPI
jgi:lactoylglutathione lyase